MFDTKLTTVIYNPAAAAGRVGRDWPNLSRQLTDIIGDVSFVPTEAAGHGIELAERAVRQGATTVFSLGGDGTHSEVVNGIMRAEADVGAITLGVLPAGTGGDLARILEPPRDPIEAARYATTVESRPIDIGVADFVDADGRPARRYFLNVASFGIGGLVDTIVNESSKALGGRVAFFVGTVRALLKYRPATVRLWLDGEDVGEHTIQLVAIGNGRYCGGGMFMAPEAELDDGVFDVAIIRDAPLGQRIAFLRRIYSGTHAELSAVDTYRASEIRAELVGDAPAWIDLDGEAPGFVPATFSIQPGAIRLLG